MASMKRAEAESIVRDLIIGQGDLIDHFKEYKVCGSIRRLKSEVKDIDIVAIPKSEDSYNFGEPELNATISRLDPEGQNASPDVKRFLLGPKIKRFLYKGIQIDIYLATKETFSTLCLIRTGSTEHNISLTTLARSKGMKLFANGTGLCRVDKDDEIINIVSADEDQILTILLGHVPSPEERER